MWTYERRLEYPVKICKPDPNAAQLIKQTAYNVP